MFLHGITSSTNKRYKFEFSTKLQNLFKFTAKWKKYFFKKYEIITSHFTWNLCQTSVKKYFHIVELSQLIFIRQIFDLLCIVTTSHFIQSILQPSSGVDILFHKKETPIFPFKLSTCRRLLNRSYKT